MSAATTTRPPTSAASSFSAVFLDDDDDEAPHLDAGEPLTRTKYNSSLNSHPIVLRTPIHEEEDYETSSETANEPLTPIDNHHPQGFQHINDGMPFDSTETTIHKQTPLILNTSATPPTSSEDKKDPFTTTPPRSPKSPLLKRPTSSSKRIKKVMSGLFRRANSQSGTFVRGSLLQEDTSEPRLGEDHRDPSIRDGSASNSLFTTRSNTPPSPGPGSATSRNSSQKLSVQRPSDDDFFTTKKKHRSSTAISFRDRFHRHKITFSQANEPKPDNQRHRATSVDLESSNGKPPKPTQDAVQHISRQVWGMAAETGIGLKSRRMSMNLPDDFTVDVVELYSEFADQSKLLGRRGKSVGKGATANVRLMQRKGGSNGEVFAVKEFRGKSSNEVADDYEKKVKSEYSIAKSLHHPNIVQTIRLCTHNGRWNHVMEFCEQGDLFSLVSQKYLARQDHQLDRLCIFKQLIQGLNYLHSNGIAHRDVKLENLLITKESKLKITDFGVSEVFAGIHPGLRSAGGHCGKSMQEVRLCAPGICGSPPYIAPEVIAKKGEYDPRPLDVWGAAIVMLCMCANGSLWEQAVPGSSPLYDDLVRGWDNWKAKHTEHDAPSITESDYPYVGFFDSYINPPALRRLLLTMLNPDPRSRVTMNAVASNRWLKNVECCQFDSYDDTTTVIDASKSGSCKKITKLVHHNHLPPSSHLGHKIIRQPDMP